MAEVYVAEAESMAGFKKKVAIKRILPDLVKDEKFVRMFLDEARLSLHLNHANIVSVFDIGKSSSTYFIVMEFVEGTNLKTILQDLHRRRTTLPVHMAVWVLNEILKGLEYAHTLRDNETGRSLGIVHRDISPPNILISWNGEVKLVDFGLAKASTQLESTDPGVVKGKFSYLAPEAAQGLEVDARADIFAVGILAYEMLTGKRLFLGESDYKTVEMVRRAEVPSISAQNPEVTPELERIILRALARDPAERYQLASECADDLLAFLFSRSLKVSARDLSEAIGDLKQAAPSLEESTAQGGNLILRLIDDEFAEIRSLDDAAEIDEGGPQTGSMPLQSLSDPFGFDPSAPLRLDDFHPSASGSGEADADPTPVPAPGSAPMSRPRDKAAASAAPPAAAGKSGSSMLWVMLLLLVAAGGGAYYWLIVMGNLSKFTG
jgi:serine/threonine-protein kinase